MSDATLIIRAQPDRPVPSVPAAGLLRRIAALAYDLLLLASVLIACTLIGVGLHHGTAITPGSAASLAYRAALAAITVAFFVGFWTYGQTLGMRA
ncbi:MAG TPA: RDD family protein, partial [Gammaproteobacteria bacterium]|nr:RDD family protein [Gammaproteobacteria bacterium]